MKKFGILRDWRVLLVIVALMLAVVAIHPTFQKGVIIESVDATSPLYGLVEPGETIEWANEISIQTVDDIHAFDDYTGVFRFMHSGQLDLAEITTPGLGITVVEKPFSNIKLGMDMVGGTRVLLKPVGENITSDIIQQTLSTLDTRINTYGLKETKFQEVTDISGNSYIQIEIAGGSKKEIDDLLSKQGRFIGKIPIEVLFDNENGVLELGDNDYDIKWNNNSLTIDDKTVYANTTFTLDEIEIELANYTSNGALFISTVLAGEDVTSVCMQDNPGICRSTFYQKPGGWEFAFQIFITTKSAQKFADVTAPMESLVDPNSGESHLASRIYFFLDDVEITSLSISSDLKGKAYTQPMITGGDESQEEAIKEKLRLQSILQSGALPVELEVIKVDQISPSLGAEFMNAALLTAFIAIFAVAGVIFIRYRKIKILIPMILWSLFELILVLGAAAMIKWTIDLASVAGIIAAIGTGTNDQVMMIDEILMGGEKDKIYTLKQKMKKAFFIIFAAAATIIAAMLPLMFIGIGVMKGFAITTLLGVLIGIFITRPAFAKVIEKVLEK